MKKYLKGAIVANCFIVISCFAAQVQSQTEAQKIFFKAQLSPAQSTHQLKPVDTSCAEANVLHYFKEANEACEEKKAKNYFHNYSEAGGSGIFVLDTATNILEFNIEYVNLSGDALMAHFHGAAPGSPGNIVQTLCGPPPALPHHAPAGAIGISGPQVAGEKCPEGRSGVLKGSYKIIGQGCDDKKTKSCTRYTLQQELNNLMCGNLYVNIHTFLNQPGELRGQIIPLTYPGSIIATCNKLAPKK